MSIGRGIDSFASSDEKLDIDFYEFAKQKDEWLKKRFDEEIGQPRYLTIEQEFNSDYQEVMDTLKTLKKTRVQTKFDREAKRKEEKELKGIIRGTKRRAETSQSPSRVYSNLA